MSQSWVPFYKEVVEVLLGFEDKQNELIALLRTMNGEGLPVVPLEDTQPDGHKEPLTVMDPFTFMANFSRVGDPEAKKLCSWIKSKWKLNTNVPVDFAGRANIPPMGAASWFFTSTGKGRKDSDIALLWQLARQAFGANIENIDVELIAKCLQIPNVGLSKLASGLSWLSPKGFMPLSGPILPFLKERGVEFDSKALQRNDLNEYLSLMKAAHEVSYDNVALNDEAWKWSKIEPEKAAAPLVPLPNVALNRILYGPPGTGKTFNAIPRAVAIIDGEAPADREECQRRFDELRRAGQIGFVTFHQSFSYEEFIEGLRPKLEEGTGSVGYEVRSGVLKSAALQAIVATLKKADPETASFESLWEGLIKKVEDDPGWQMDGINKKGQYRLEFQEKRVIATNLANVNKLAYPVTRALAEKAWTALRSTKLDDIHSDEVLQVTHVGTHPSVIAAIVREMKRMEALRSAEQNPTETLVERSLDAAQSYLNNSPDYRADFHNAPRYVLIIDEINRGNISRILGELITLLEEDKRLGAPNELRVTLPVSLETFALPPNLYILGTMNTADKSLALLDIALRRRFVFEEIRPDFSLDSLNLSAEMRRVIEVLNLRLEFALDREHCLGHAYFMGVETPEQFDCVFREKIIPLLQEFFYNDWATLRGVLGESGPSGHFIRELKAPPGMTGRTAWRWWFDVDRDQAFSSLNALSANYPAETVAAPAQQ